MAFGQSAAFADAVRCGHFAVVFRCAEGEEVLVHLYQCDADAPYHCRYEEVFVFPEQAEVIFLSGSVIFSTYYINMSILLAFAATFPNAQILLMFIIPVKMKWMGIVYGVLLGVQLISGVGSPLGDLFYRCAITASLLTFGLFWITSRNRIHMTPKQMKRRHEFKQEVKMNPKVTRHKCAICGQTDQDSDNLEFRFCSKCNGNYEYCQQHLFTHKHVE